ncbi:MAG TPA: single-stranded DNA-binding protein [Candidatus Poseidoniales archaeon]|jgi:single-strand selective monofunctional uracil DNA glycosylase|nr:MAG: single-stranded DNA-binding protein [Euryarchaeota archaeon]HIG34150.1 single-stranded DNA-binding protein [Candidatus Poseidoniales archaeon]HIL67875.1 single-stranded DNA-binding protein [Candidatus Poseidoniales archaeon]
MTEVIEGLIRAASGLRDDAQAIARRLESDGVADCVYNPLMYAWEVHEEFIRRSGGSGAKSILLGMNPGPHGMGQMGVPFAATSVVRDLLGISGIDVGQPVSPHSNRPVNGLSHPKEEVSGTRLWDLLQQRYGGASQIFQKVFIINHCPLMILDGPRGTNVTPNNISGPVMNELLERCDQHLREAAVALGAEEVIGIGKYAEKRAHAALMGMGIRVKSCWHPSPASPLANRNGGADWRENVSAVLP